MKIKEFNEVLLKKLENLSINDKNEIIFYYNDLINGKLDENMSEEDAVMSLGDIDDIVSKLLEENNNLVENDNEIDLNFSKKLFKRNMVIDKKIDTINIVGGMYSYIFRKSEDKKLRVNFFNSPTGKIKLVSHNNELFIYEKRKKFIYSILLSIIPSIIVVALIPFVSFWYILLPSVILLQSLFGALSRPYTVYIDIDKTYNYNINAKSSRVKYTNIDINNISGGLKSGSSLFKDCNINNINFRTTSGGVVIKNDILEEQKKLINASILTSSGIIKIKNAKSNKQDLRSRSGSIIIYMTSILEKLTTTTFSGLTKVKDSTITLSSLKGKSGSIIIKNSTILDDSTLKTNSGLSKIKNSKGDNITTSNTSGSFIIKSSSLKNINSTTKTGSCIIKKSEVHDILYNSIHGALVVKSTKIKNVLAKLTNGNVIIKNIPSKRENYILDVNSKSLIVEKSIGFYNNEENNSDNEKYTIKTSCQSGFTNISFRN